MPALLLALGALLSRLIATKAGAWLLSTLAFVGLGFATQSIAITPILNQVQSYASGAGGAVEWLRFFNVDKAITMIFSAITAKHALTSARAFLRKV